MSSRRVIIDIRPAAVYLEGHLPEAHSFPWPIPGECLCRLPPREADLEIVVNAATDRTAVRQMFDRFGYRKIAWTEVGAGGGSGKLVLTTALPTELSWSPNPCLAAHIQQLEGLLGGPGVALDAGSGVGRDMAYLALRGWLVLGLENRRKLIRESNALFAAHSVGNKAGQLLADVRVGLPLRAVTLDLVNVCRFIHRPSLPIWINLLRPGGFVVYSHFLEGCEKTRVGRPRNADGYFLEGELERAFVELGLDILNAERRDLPDGRPMVHMVARKPVR